MSEVHSELLQSDPMVNRFLVFAVGDQSFALEISCVIEIVEVLPITKIPNMIECIKGIINLRGAIIPIIDLRLRFGYTETVYTDRTCIVVVEHDGMSVGFIVEEVKEVLSIAEEEISPPTSLSDQNHSQYVKGIGMGKGEVQLLLDCTLLMDVAN